MAPLKTLLSTAALAFMLMLGAASNAAAAGTVPCWKQVISDWYDGRIDNVYPLHCYHEAIDHLPEDVQTYSSAKDEINRALMAALRHDREGYGGGGGGAAGAGIGATASGPEGPGGGEAPGGVLTRLLEALGPSNAESVPLPLLVLAVIALLLLAAASASFVAKRLQARRPPGPPPVPATAPAQPPKQS